MPCVLLPSSRAPSAGLAEAPPLSSLCGPGRLGIIASVSPSLAVSQGLVWVTHLPGNRPTSQMGGWWAVLRG